MLTGCGLFVIAFFFLLKSRNLHLWIGSYCVEQITRRNSVDKSRPIHVYFTLVDHFEPFHNATREQALLRVKKWCSVYPEIAKKFKDADGRHPKHAIFYPEETYDSEVFDALAEVCKSGFFDMEIHLHHNDDNEKSLRKKLIQFKDTLHHRHGLLRKDPATGEVVYGFIHGNWALDNSRRDGKWCGVNNELIILKETGCYADFTLPSAPNNTQTSKINSIYYAQDDPQNPKSHNTGRDVSRGGKPWGDLMIIQGPLALNWRKRKTWIMPRIVNGELSLVNGPTPDRLAIWVEHAPAVYGEPNTRFIKLYTHGCDSEEETDQLLQTGLNELYSLLTRHLNDGRNYVLHFVSPYEMYQNIKLIEGKRL